MVLYVLFESATGFALFKLNEFDETNATEESVQKQVVRFETFSKIAHLEVIFLSFRLFYHLHSLKLPLKMP
jgi:hypothetical protein